ncbi:cupin domain-containing protein [Pseudomonas kielensis]|uniref:cupin domain-containing protein n=1 Tax=Pseudomonas kielensis TaxID=2762577 RepID=UPI0022402665|nr:cupin domain-containing protein [Pseudomonas kielensis]UZM16311.1 cupin domain-containing protein [Pseudomonas kielensis]
MKQNQKNARDLISALELEIHEEGGYYRRTFESGRYVTAEREEGGQRHLMTSIYYLLTQDSPVGFFHLNHSDIVHYYHLGDAIEYSLIHPDGRLQKVLMGSDVASGQVLQLHVPGGIWKASKIRAGTAGYGLISEAVSPGFDYADMEMSDRQKLTAQFPEHSELIEKMTQA